MTVLATSRSPLDIEGELVWPVPPLSMQKRGDAGETGASDAARLFADRASYVQSRFELSEDVAGVIEAIVRQVDGIPLAIELAAARVRVLSAQEIADGLDDHLRLLRGGHRSDPRHQTIRASLDWSHELLTDRERQLFARLSVFSGGFDLEAATAVCAGGAIVPGQILDEIQGLVDKSLLAVERRAGATRFRMLDFVRQYAAERLAAAGEDVPLADRHRAYFGELAQRADRELWALVPAGRARLDDESPNLRAAIDDGCARAPDDALAMVGALGLYWRVRGRLAEGVTATEQSLRGAPPEPSPGRALALAKLSLLSFWLGDFARTQSSATSALEMGAAIGDTRSQALALGQLGALVILGDPGAGDPMLMRAAELARTAGDDVALCDSLTPLAISCFFQDDPGAMRSPLEEALRVAEAIGFEDIIRWCLWCLAHTAFSAGELAGARAPGERALAMMPGQDQLSRYCAVEVLCLLDASMGAADAARERAEADVEQSRQERLRLGTGVLMHALGDAALAAGDLDRAAQWARSLYEHESEVCYLAWHAQEILVAVALARNDSAQAKIHVERLLAAAEPLRNRRARAVGHLGGWPAPYCFRGTTSGLSRSRTTHSRCSWTTGGARGLSTPSMWSLRSPCSRDSMSAPSGSLLQPRRSGPRSASWPSRCLGSELSGTWPRPALRWATRVLKGLCRTAPGCLSGRGLRPARPGGARGRHVRVGQPEPGRAASGRACQPRSEQSRHRQGTVHISQHGQDIPFARLREARRGQPDRAGPARYPPLAGPPTTLRTHTHLGDVPRYNHGLA